MGAMQPQDTSLPMDALLSQTGWVRDLARRLVHDPNVADDLAQDVCLAALEHRPDPKRPLRAWLATVLRNRARQVVRGDQRRVAREEVAARVEASSSTADLVERLAVHQALVARVARLDEPYRAAILLRYFEQRTPAQIARQLELPVATVKTRLARGLERLRRELERERRADGQSWLSALVLFVRDGASAPAAPALGALLLSTQAKLSLVAVLIAVGVWYPWSRSAPLEAPELAQAPAAVAPEARVEDPATALVEEAEPQVVRAQVPRTAAAAPEEELAPGTSPTELQALVRSADARPVAGARVRFEPAGAGEERVERSDAAGRVVFPDVEEAGLVVSAQSDLVTVCAGNVSGTRRDAQPVLVVAERRPFAGRVVDEQGFPLEGARVEVTLPTGFRARFDEVMDYSNFQVFRTASDAEGFFELPDTPGIDGARLRARLANYTTFDAALPEQSDLGLVLELARAQVLEGALVGRVIDHVGDPVPDARVVFGIHPSRTDERGMFGFDLSDDSSSNRLLREHMGRQPKRLIAVKAGHQPAQLTLDLDPETGLPLATEPIVLQLGDPPLAISGRVVDENGVGLEGIEVWVADPSLLGFGGRRLEVLESVMAGQADTRSVIATTDRRGSFELPGLQARDYTLRAMDPEVLLTSITDGVPAGSQNVQVVLDQSGLWKRVAGRVVDHTGRGGRCDSPADRFAAAQARRSHGFDVPPRRRRSRHRPGGGVRTRARPAQPGLPAARR